MSGYTSGTRGVGLCFIIIPLRVNDGSLHIGLLLPHGSRTSIEMIASLNAILWGVSLHRVEFTSCSRGESLTACVSMYQASAYGRNRTPI